MDMTDKPTSLVEALIQIQAQLPKLTKSKTANYGKYADLSQITEAVMPLLAAHGLAWTCCPTLRDDGAFVLRYALVHSASGEERGGDYPLPASGSPQQAGSSVTYSRRYSLCAVLGLVADEDDDGAAAEPKPARSRRSSSVDAEPTSDPETRKKRMFALFNEVGPKERHARLADISTILDRPVSSSSDLSPADVEAVITVLAKRKREQAKESSRG